MRAGLLAVGVAGAAVLVAAPATPATAAQAADGGAAITFTPRAAPAGTDVDLRVSGCDGTTGSASSAAFVAPARLAPSADDPTLFAEARVKSSAAPDAYRVSVTCDGVDGKVTGTLTVLGPDASPTPSPTALVHAGGGGTAAHRQALAVHQDPAAAPSEGPGTRHALIGLGLAAIAAVSVAVRSVRRRRPTGSSTRR
ncbi:hypothetical protein [Streptomyces fractus]|uniref:hypothetical protein n=1 Tax=Streptomyces fractus TaxID=641806 RepID=UPI003CEB6F35